ncbi:MAG: 50S ribosomal protein L11 methyltransferase [Proteobacteria bacterium]|nr:50S ribosomal protein L11 methyltransferase [Pseudomonadota bacterium]
MSAEGAVDSWKTSFPCTRAEAEAIDASEIAIDAVLMTTEEVEDDRERWRLDAYTQDRPDAAMIAALRALAPSAEGIEPVVEALSPANWVAMSQQGLEPIAEGRFVVHTSAHPVEPPPGGRAFLIDAGRAFGTGHHATTAGCLATLERLDTEARFDNIIDLGTGTGLLAFAAKTLWPDANVVATDIDPTAIEVTRRNAEINGIDHIELVVADGALSPAITDRAPYDLVIANILAGPLISMASEIAAMAAAPAAIVLAGLLNTQADQVLAAFAACGCTEEDRDVRGDWTILLLRAGIPRYVPARPIDPKGRDGWALDI